MSAFMASNILPAIIRRQGWAQLQPVAQMLSNSLNSSCNNGTFFHLLQQPQTATCLGLLQQQHRCSSVWTSVQQIEKLRTDLSGPPTSLQYDHRPDPIPPEWRQHWWGRLFLKLTLYDSKKNQMIIGGQTVYDAICEQVDDGALQRAFGMDLEKFYSTFTLLSIHVWLIYHRLGTLGTGRDIKFFRQRFFEHFQRDVEKRIYDHGVQMNVTKWLRKLEHVFYSSCVSFDLALKKESSESVEQVVLREFFGGDASKILQAELITKYIMHELACIKITDEQAIMKGHIRFSRAPFADYRKAMREQYLEQQRKQNAKKVAEGQSTVEGSTQQESKHNSTESKAPQAG